MTKKSKWRRGVPKEDGYYFCSGSYHIMYFNPTPHGGYWTSLNGVAFSYQASDRWIGPLVRPKLPKEKSHE